MEILEIFARTIILFVHCIVQAIGMVIEGGHKLLGKLIEYLAKVDNTLITQVEKTPKKSTQVPTKV